MVLIALLLSCRTPEEPEVREPAPLDDLALLARLSLDLRGRRPSEAEILAVEADPSLLDGIAADFVEDPGFADQVMDWYGDVFRSRADKFIPGADGDGAFLDEIEKLRFTRSVGDEPVRLLRDIVADGGPWTDFVTLDTTVADEHLLAHFPLEDLDPTATGWRKARYTDGRPAAGVLSTNGMWWRYTTTNENVNRSRAEAVARILLCDGRFVRPIEFSSSQGTSDPSDLQERAQVDPNCVGCHVALDPMGSLFFGFWRNHPESFTEAREYYPERELMWQERTGIPPGYYGEPIEGLYALGRRIADDNRYVNCAVERAYSFLHDQDPGVAETDAITGYRERFIEGGLTLQALYAAVAADPSYRSADPEVAGTVGQRWLRDAAYGRAVEGITGFTWTADGLHMLESDQLGVRVLSGGMDGMIVTQAASDHSTTSALVEERLAEGAAAWAVAREAEQPASERALFREIADLSAAPSEAELREQLAMLILRVHTRRVAVDSADVDDLVALYGDLVGDGALPSDAWALVLSGLLRHPDFVHY